MYQAPANPTHQVGYGGRKSSNIRKVSIFRNLASYVSEMYYLKMTTFKNVQLEKFLVLMKNYKTVNDRTGTTSG